MLIWLANQDIPVPTDPNLWLLLLEYGGMGFAALLVLVITALIWKLGPTALKAWTEMNICAAKQATVLERTTAAVEEHRSQSAQQHAATMEAMGTQTQVIVNLRESTKDLSNEIKRRNGH